MNSAWQLRVPRGFEPFEAYGDQIAVARQPEEPAAFQLRAFDLRIGFDAFEFVTVEAAGPLIADVCNHKRDSVVFTDTSGPQVRSERLADLSGDKVVEYGVM